MGNTVQTVKDYGCIPSKDCFQNNMERPVSKVRRSKSKRVERTENVGSAELLRPGTVAEA